MRVRAATLNVWAMPPPLGHRVAERLRAIGDRLASLELDVIGFQEVWTQEARRILVSAGRRAGLHHVWHRDAAFGGSGLLVLSRFPLRAPSFERYLLGGLPYPLTHPDYYGGKGFVQLQVETPNGPLVIVDTHLQARYGSRVAHEYRGHRTGQIVQLARALRRVEAPIIVLGDFNFREHHDEYRIWAGLSGVRDVAALLDRREPTAYPESPYREAHGTARRIDYVFVRDGGDGRWFPRTVRRIFDKTWSLEGEVAAYSDHAGVLAEVELVPGAVALPAIPPRAVKRAEWALTAGKERAVARLQSGRAWTGAGVAAVGLLAAAHQVKPLSRRAFLAGALRAAGLAALLPMVGYSVFSEWWVPEELEAFRRVSDQLGQLGRSAAETSFRRVGSSEPPLEHADLEASADAKDSLPPL